jgi:hypothetical protein
MILTVTLNNQWTQVPSAAVLALALLVATPS